MRLSFVLVSFFVCGCASTHEHKVFDLDADKNIVASVKDRLGKDCAPWQCAVKRCWKEMRDLTFCEVEFSYVTGWQQQKLLSAAVKDLEGSHSQIGLCGHDSTESIIVGALIGGVGAGAASAALGGHSGSASLAGSVGATSYSSNMVTSTREKDDRLQSACSGSAVLIKE